FRRPPGITPFR
nr:bradykinin-related peptide [Polypterus senegalus]